MDGTSSSIFRIIKIIRKIKIPPTKNQKENKTKNKQQRRKQDKTPMTLRFRIKGMHKSSVLEDRSFDIRYNGMFSLLEYTD